MPESLARRVDELPSAFSTEVSARAQWNGFTRSTFPYSNSYTEHPRNQSVNASIPGGIAWFYESQHVANLIAFSELEIAENFSHQDFSNVQDIIHARKETRERLDRLRSIAVDEGLEISIDSERDLWSFLYSLEFTRRPYLVLLDNGNLRAVWKNAEREQIGVQFLGRGLVQYVLFSLRSPGQFMARASGRDTLQNIRRQIETHDLWRLMSS